MKRIGNFESLKVAGVDILGGGGGLDPSYINPSSTIAGTVTSTADTWLDVTNAVLTVTPSGTQKWEVIFEGVLQLFTNSAGNWLGSVGIFDSANNLIDEAIVTTSLISTGGTASNFIPVRVTARETISSAKTYKLRIRCSSTSATAATGYKEYTGSFTGIESGDKFYAKRVFGGTGGTVVGNPSYIAHAYQTSSQGFNGGSAQDLNYSNKVDPNSILDITGAAIKFTVPIGTLGIVRVKTKMSPNGAFNAANNFFGLPFVYRTSDNAYMGVGDRSIGTWTGGAAASGFYFPQGEAFFSLVPGTQYTIKAYSDNSLTLSGGTNGNGDTNYTVVEIW